MSIMLFSFLDALSKWSHRSWYWSCIHPYTGPRKSICKTLLSLNQNFIFDLFLICSRPSFVLTRSIAAFMLLLCAYNIHNNWLWWVSQLNGFPVHDWWFCKKNLTCFLRRRWHLCYHWWRAGLFFNNHKPEFHVPNYGSCWLNWPSRCSVLSSSFVPPRFSGPS
jgi:hypothetical protein